MLFFLNFNVCDAFKKCSRDTSKNNLYTPKFEIDAPNTSKYQKQPYFERRHLLQTITLNITVFMSNFHRVNTQVQHFKVEPKSTQKTSPTFFHFFFPESDWDEGIAWDSSIPIPIRKKRKKLRSCSSLESPNQKISLNKNPQTESL